MYCCASPRLTKKSFSVFIFALTLFNLLPENIYPQPASSFRYWMFEEEAAPYKDFYALLNAVSTNSPARIPGKVGFAQKFNPENVVNLMPDSSFEWHSDQSFSIEFWMRDSTVSQVENEVIAGRDDSGSVIGSNLHWWVGLDYDTGFMQFTLLDNFRLGVTIRDSTNIADGEWHHVAAVRENDQNKNLLYVDGALAASAEFDYLHDFTAVNAPIQIGLLNDYLNNNSYHYDGAIDELAIYNTALTQEAVQRHYNNGLNGIGYRGKIIQLFLENARQDSSQFLFDISVQNAGLLNNRQLGNYLGNSRLSLTRNPAVLDTNIQISSVGSRFDNDDYIFSSGIDSSGNINLIINFTNAGAGSALRHLAKELLCTVRLSIVDTAGENPDSAFYRDIRWIAGNSTVTTGDSLYVPVYFNEFESVPLSADIPSNIPVVYNLEQNFPNPFNPATKIKFAVPKAGTVNLSVYNILGQKVKDLVSGFVEAGVHTVNFNSDHLSSGIYIYKLQTENYIQSRKMILLK